MLTVADRYVALSLTNGDPILGHEIACTIILAGSYDLYTAITLQHADLGLASQQHPMKKDRPFTMMHVGTMKDLILSTRRLSSHCISFRRSDLLDPPLWK